MNVRILHGDAIEQMRTLDADSVDAIVTDPPYEMSFMSRKWDGTGIAFDPATWREVLRVAKPGAHLLAFGGTRTHHRMMCAIEDAGWEIRDCLQWLYGSGFPKSLSVDKAIDKAAGVEREVLGVKPSDRPNRHGGRSGSLGGGVYTAALETAPATPDAERWQGWGTALKPAYEPIVLARKPLSERTVAGNVLMHGAGALNIDGCRIGTTDVLSFGSRHVGTANGIYGKQEPKGEGIQHTSGRWPANVILSHHPDCVPNGVKRVQSDSGGVLSSQRDSMGYHGADNDSSNRLRTYADTDGYETVESWACVEGCPVAMLDAQSGERPVSGSAKNGRPATGEYRGGYGGYAGRHQGPLHNDTGGASRFFKVIDPDAPRFIYQAKASRRERGIGNDHPTVKPIQLCRYLARLICPPGGVVLDPFMGSGTTGIAALLEGFSFIGIEREAEYIEIATARIEHTLRTPIQPPLGMVAD